MSSEGGSTMTPQEAMASSHNPFPVNPTGFLVGSYVAIGLYALHLTQLRAYWLAHPPSFGLPGRQTLLVLWIFTLSTGQAIVILSAAAWYFVGGLDHPERWGEFWWGLSVQDGLIPLMAFTAQMYFARRAWLLTGRRVGVRVIGTLLPLITLAAGVGLAVTARYWAIHPYLSDSSFHAVTENIGIPSFIVATTWMALSALTDGIITLILLVVFFRASKTSASSDTGVVAKLVKLTMETVLLTHIVGATMVVVYLASSPMKRTHTPVFWVLLEVITELYALSVLFTVNSRRKREEEVETCTDAEKQSTPGDQVSESQAVGQASSWEGGGSALDRRVEGYHGLTPFGVNVDLLRYRQGVAQPPVRASEYRLAEQGMVGISTKSSGGPGHSERACADPPSNGIRSTSSWRKRSRQSAASDTSSGQAISGSSAASTNPPGSSSGSGLSFGSREKSIRRRWSRTGRYGSAGGSSRGRVPETTPLDELVTPREEWPGLDFVQAMGLGREEADRNEIAGELDGDEEDRKKDMEEDGEGDESGGG